ncbi:MAG: MAPEG family protein [Hyphomicrobiaceae bacterium]
MAVTPIYASILALVFVGLSARVIGARRGAGVALGDGGDRLLLRRQRVHANFAEYVPLALVLLLLAEQQGAARPVLHALGLALLAGRLIHAFGVSQEPERLPLRVAGMVLTLGTLVSAAAINLALAAGWSLIGR